MATMTERATYALDRSTTQAIRELAASWQVSQAEVLRRAVRLALDQHQSNLRPPGPAEVVAHYRAQGELRPRAEAERLAAEQTEQRHQEALRRDSRHDGRNGQPG